MKARRGHCLVVQRILVFPMILSLLGFTVQVQTATTYDCEGKGCALDASVMGPPVCGQDGFTYHNECLAYCQGVTVASMGPCPGKSFTSDASVAPLIINITTMKRFQPQQFRFVTARNPETFVLPPNPDEYFITHAPGGRRQYRRVMQSSNTNGAPNDLNIFDSNFVASTSNETNTTNATNTTPTTRTLQFMRITHEGFEYMAKVTSNMRPGGGGSTGRAGRAAKSWSSKKNLPPKPNLRPPWKKKNRGLLGSDEDASYSLDDVEVDEGGDLLSWWDSVRRQLAIIGGDSRVMISDTTRPPYASVAQMDYGMANDEGGCTGTLIGRTTALTAGHCIYDPTYQQWTTHRRIAPARYRSGSETVEPYGMWGIDYATVFTEWSYGGDMSYDMAVVKYQSKQYESTMCYDYYPGDAGGYVGFDRSSALDGRLYAASITGYPADKPAGTMWMSTSDQPWSEYSQPHMAIHTADTFGGQSGSSVIVPATTADGANTYLALGVHAYGYSPNNVGRYNVAIMIEGDYMYDSVYQWSERAMDEQLPNCNEQTVDRSCPCSRRMFFIFRFLCYFFWAQYCTGQRHGS